VLVIGGIMLGVWRLNPDRPASQANVATEVFIQVERPNKEFYSSNSKTTEERASSPDPLDIMSSPESVQERISHANLHWSTLWQDVSLIFYGPPGYVGPPDTIRAQIWLRQPNETKMIAGPVGGRPDYQFLGRDKGFHQATVDSLLRWYYLAFDRHLALGTNIGSLATPVSSLERGQGRLVVQGIEVVAGHPALVVDQLNNKGKLESRIWVDTVTGVTLRKRLFAPSDPDIVLVTADLGFGVFDEFRERFPKQFLNVGVAEQNMSGLAAGLALEGHTVFTYSIGNFPTLRCLEQIRNDICYHSANVKIVCVGGGMSYGAVGMSHHATEDLAILRSLPGMLVFCMRQSNPSGQWPELMLN